MALEAALNELAKQITSTSSSPAERLFRARFRARLASGGRSGRRADPEPRTPSRLSYGLTLLSFFCYLPASFSLSIYAVSLFSVGWASPPFSGPVLQSLNLTKSC